MPKSAINTFTDALYAWLRENVEDAEVIEGTGDPDHPVRMTGTLDGVRVVLLAHVGPSAVHHMRRQPR